MTDTPDSGILVQGDFTSVTEMIEKLRVDPVSGFTFTAVSDE